MGYKDKLLFKSLRVFSKFVKIGLVGNVIYKYKYFIQNHMCTKETLLLITDLTAIVYPLYSHMINTKQPSSVIAYLGPREVMKKMSLFKEMVFHRHRFVKNPRNFIRESSMGIRLYHQEHWILRIGFKKDSYTEVTNMIYSLLHSI